MERDFLLPDVGEGLETASIVEWHVREGDVVQLNQPLVTIETEKAAVELPSPFEGRVVLLRAAPGEELRVGQLVARIDVGTGESAEPGPRVEPAREQEPTRRQETAPEATTGPVPEAVSGPAPEAAPEPWGVQADTEEASESPSILVGYGVKSERAPGRREREWTRGVAEDARGSARGTAAAAQQPSAAQRPPASRPLAKPPTRWLAKTLGIDLRRVAPTGLRGEVTAQDVRAAAGNGSVEDVAEVEEIPVVGIRARIAERMTVSRSTIPEASCGLWVDCERLLELRAKLRADVADSEGELLTPFALIAWMVPFALLRNPMLNARYDAGGKVIRVHRSVHLGIATSTANGLLVPVVRDAHELGLMDFARELARLGRSGREGTLAPGELTGSTFTISNYGALGLDDGNPVINAPEAAILGVGAIRPRAAVWDEKVAVRSTAKLICAFDHRVCDGSEAAGFLRRLKDTIEEPELLIVER